MIQSYIYTVESAFVADCGFKINLFCDVLLILHIFIAKDFW